MKVKINYDNSLENNIVIINVNENSPFTNNIKIKLQDLNINSIYCYKDNKTYFIDLNKIYRIYSYSSNVFIQTESKEYEVRKRLYTLEEELKDFGFIRINNSEIININKIDNFDFSYTGKIIVNLKNNLSLSVSRRNLKKIKEIIKKRKI